MLKTPTQSNKTKIKTIHAFLYLVSIKSTQFHFTEAKSQYLNLLIII